MGFSLPSVSYCVLKVSRNFAAALQGFVSLLVVWFCLVLCLLVSLNQNQELSTLANHAGNKSKCGLYFLILTHKQSNLLEFALQYLENVKILCIPPCFSFCYTCQHYVSATCKEKTSIV